MPVTSQRSNKVPTRSQVKSRLAGIAVLLVFCAVVAAPHITNKGIDWVNAKANLGLPRLPDKGYNLGLDLQGGAHLVYQAKTDAIPEADKADSVEGVRDVIERRVRGGLGVAEPLVQTTKVGSDYRIIVELPGVTDVNEAIKSIGETPVLEFKEQNNEPPRDLTAAETKELNDFNKAAAAKAKTAVQAVQRGQNFAEAAAKYSEDTTTKATGGDLGFIDQSVYPEIYAWAKTHAVNEISSSPIAGSTGLNIVKKLAEKDGDAEVTASHLLICYKGAERCDTPQYATKEEALAKIQEIKKTITPQNFVEMVKKYSTEPGAAQSGGSLGTFKKGAMVQAFEDEVFAQKVGTISEPVETQFGYHLIYKTAQETSKQYQVARILVKTKTKADIVPPAEQWKSTGLTGKQLKHAEVTQDQRTGAIQVSLNFNDEGTKLFADITGRNVGKAVAVFLDGEIISAPQVNEAITTGSAVITGGFTLSQAKLLAQRLNSGALPVPVELLSQQTVDATLGADSLAKSFRAGVYGLIAVMLFMIIYYRLPGLLSVASLAFYALLNLAVFKLIGVTLTLSGIAGFILSIGMAVDANVLVFERLKEELTGGRTLKSATEEAFLRSWPSIRDSHITALISCVFLIWFGTGFIQGFAVILAIGTLINLFTAITVTRTIMRFVFEFINEKANVLFLGHRK
jgi:protein-export membrane protein SecD